MFAHSAHKMQGKVRAMAYIRLSGTGNAFGWCRDGKITAGGLTPDADYLLVCERGEFPMHTDAHGAWSGQLLHDLPLCVARDAQIVLYDDSRTTPAAAAALLSARLTPPAPHAETLPEKPREAPPESPAASEAEAKDEPPVVYRPPTAEPPVDALPELVWPEAAKRLKPFFDAQCPVRLFDWPGWRIVKAREAGMDCCFGYRAENDRVAETLYGVRARGGMTPPRGLNGYRFERGTEGGYWILTQRV